MIDRRIFLQVCSLSGIGFSVFGCAGTKSGRVRPREEWERLIDPKQKDNPAFQYVSDIQDLPRVLLIGDSISVGYTQPVRELMQGKATVHRIPENGGDTNRGLNKLIMWLGSGEWDVIHFNWGLHDLKYFKDDRLDLSGEQVNSLKEYEDNLEILVQKLKQTGAILIWATTTPIPEGCQGRIAGDEVKYNAVALKIMQRHRIMVNDLHALVLPHLSKYQRPQNVHFNTEGTKFLAEAVAEKITQALSL